MYPEANYRPPEAPLSPAAPRLRRPVGVWLVCGYLVVLIVIGLGVDVARIATGLATSTLDPGYRDPWNLGGLAASYSLVVFGLVSLFRLKAWAVWPLSLMTAVQIALTLLFDASGGLRESSSPADLVSRAIFSVLIAALPLYVWSLRRRGILH